MEESSMITTTDMGDYILIKDAENEITQKKGKGNGIETEEDAREAYLIGLNATPPEPTYAELRRQAYIEAGLTNEAYIDAQRQEFLDNDDTAMNEYVAKRDAIKAQIPKQ